MKEYFLLQYKMTNRKFVAFGIPIVIGYVLLLFGFIWGSEYLFSKITEFAKYLYLLLGLFSVSKLSSKGRNDFLKSYFKEYNKLRILENCIIIFPFVAYFLYKGMYLCIPVIIVLAILMTLVKFNSSFNYTIPTPFSKNPFEFSVGFRKTFYIFPIAYYVAYESIIVGNFNLGLFSILLIYAVLLSYYSYVENEYYVWSYKLSAKDFLIRKIKTGVYYSVLLSAPVVFALGVSFYKELELILSFLLISICFLVTVILAKYSAYPNKMNLSQGVLIALGVLVPPIFIGIIPYFYLESIKRLKNILND